MTTSGTTSDNELQRMTTGDNEWYNDIIIMDNYIIIIIKDSKFERISG